MAPVRSTTLPDGGFALPLVIMITTIIMLLSTAFLTLADTEQTIAQNQVAETQALYIADAGVEKAVASLRNGWQPSQGSKLTGALTDGLGQKVGEYEVEATSVTDNVVELVATGYVPAQAGFQARKTLKATISAKVLPIFENAIASRVGEGGVALELKGNNSITSYPDSSHGGNVYADGDAVIKGSNTISGALRATGYITRNGNNKIGSVEEHAPVQPFPSVDTSTWESRAKSGGETLVDEEYSGTFNITLGNHYFAKNLSFSGNGTLTLKDGAIIYVEENITFSGKVTVNGKGTFITHTGTITVNGNVEYSASGQTSLALVSLKQSDSDSGIILKGGVEVAGVLYAPYSKVELKGGGGSNTVITGAVVGAPVLANGNITIEYDTSLLQNAPPVVGTWEVTAWQEQYPVF